MADLKYKDNDDQIFSLEMETGSGGLPQKRPVHGLPAGVVSSLSTLSGAVTSAKMQVDVVTLPTGVVSSGKVQVDVITVPAAITSLLTDIENNTDGIESELTSIDGHVDGIEAKLDTANTNLGTINTSLGTIDGHVDGIEGKLDTINTSINVPSAGPKTGYKGSIGTGADVTFDSQALTEGMFVRNESTSAQTIYMGVAAAPSSTTAVSLMPGETRFVRCTNANQVNFRSSASGGAVSYSGA